MRGRCYNSHCLLSVNYVMQSALALNPLVLLFFVLLDHSVCPV